MRIQILGGDGFKEIDLTSNLLPNFQDLLYVSPEVLVRPDTKGPFFGVIISRTIREASTDFYNISVFGDIHSWDTLLDMAGKRGALVSPLITDRRSVKKVARTYLADQHDLVPMPSAHDRALGFETYAESHTLLEPAILSDFFQFMPLFATAKQQKGRRNIRFNPLLHSSMNRKYGIYLIKSNPLAGGQSALYAGISCGQLYKTMTIHFQSEGENPTPGQPIIWYRNGHLRFSSDFVNNYTWEVAWIPIFLRRRSPGEVMKVLMGYEAQLIEAYSHQYYIQNVAYYGERIGAFFQRKDETLESWIKRVVPEVIRITSVRSVDNLNGATFHFFDSTIRLARNLTENYPLFIQGEAVAQIRANLRYLEQRRKEIADNQAAAK